MSSIVALMINWVNESSVAAGAHASSCEVLAGCGLGVRSCCFFTAVRFFADDGMVATNNTSNIGLGNS